MIEDNVQLNYTVHNIRIIIFITFVGFKKNKLYPHKYIQLCHLEIQFTFFLF
jgi:hypothetical protein